MVTGDYNRDGALDLLMVGNWYATNVWTGRADAFVGAYLQGDGTGHFSLRDGTDSGFFVEGDAKATARVATEGGETLVLATQNSGPLKAFRPQRQTPARTVQLQPLDQSARLVYEGGAEPPR